ncbi:MAG: Arc family DNA-binding protein [Candidatus Phlomobacter fragariae]
MARDDPQFNFRMPHEIKEKIKRRAKMNGRSINAELTQIVLDALDKSVTVQDYKTDIEKLADSQAEEVKKMVFNTLIKLYDNKN